MKELGRLTTSLLCDGLTHTMYIVVRCNSSCEDNPHYKTRNYILVRVPQCYEQSLNTFCCVGPRLRIALEGATNVLIEVHQSDQLCEHTTPTKLMRRLVLALTACVQYVCNLNIGVIPTHETSVQLILMTRMHVGFMYSSTGPHPHVCSAPN